MLEVLDTMGKYSMIDTFVMVMMIVSFRYSIKTDVGLDVDVE